MVRYAMWTSPLRAKATSVMARIIAPMCEQYVACAQEPFRIDALWPFTERLERYGIASFGWGATWLDADETLRSHRDIGTFAADPELDELGQTRTRALLVHLRRPSMLSTIGIPDTQPFDDPDGRYSFSHNGDLEHYQAHRPRYLAEGRIHGRADTEVGARWLEDAWDGAETAVPAILAELHETFRGDANLAVLTRDGAAFHYAGNDLNPVFTFDLGPIHVASTGIHSLDRSVFKFVVPEATSRRLVPRGQTATLLPVGPARSAATA